jgi:hypothetical protein
MHRKLAVNQHIFALDAGFDGNIGGSHRHRVLVEKTIAPGTGQHTPRIAGLHQELANRDRFAEARFASVLQSSACSRPRRIESKLIKENPVLLDDAFGASVIIAKNPAAVMTHGYHFLKCLFVGG